MAQKLQRELPWCDDERAPYLATKFDSIDNGDCHVSTLPYIKGIVDMLEHIKYDILWDEVEFCEYEFEPPVHQDEDDDEWYDTCVVDDDNVAGSTSTEGEKTANASASTATEYKTFCFDALVRHKTLYT